MVFLDSGHARPRTDPLQWTARLLVGFAILAFGYFALTVGADRNGSPEIVAEPAITSSF